MNKLHLPVRFVDDGYPEAREYDNNYVVVRSHQRAVAPEHSLPRALRAGRVAIKRTLRQLKAKLTGRPGSRSAGTRTPAASAQYS